MTGSGDRHRPLSASNSSTTATLDGGNRAARPASILRSTSGSSNASPRFTFDFVDDASLGTSSTIDSSARGGGGKSSSTSFSYSSPRRRSHQARLSPSRLDARYSSRLPPAYGGGYHGYHAHSPSLSYTSNDNNEEVKRNLFGGSEGESGGDASVSAMDVSGDFTEASSSGGNSNNNGNGNNNSNNGPGTPRSQRRSMSYSRPAPSASPRSGWTMPLSPGNRSGATGSSRSIITSGASTFLTSSPRKRGAVTGVSSPLSGNLSHASVSSSVASSPANSVGGGG
eukprot:CAMPEP_0172536626 /NCGR_PEP_ID=MMETSP1067-20121228/8363_1 /TAXON_ID=265564 ORGANISM="Thalassiosira punctigera, Strain Tpunct2005C2" /NCGR_SAMPLE_ID=MMETSP1067 /ASSEMBLY_ACC=CAM_ASM_000444 /LENGTH=282 /DNA_ID=CAMNT_0013321739 /DNA_START=346 /DNA_END=1191 /DNA_ORIENTATION=+